MKTLIRKTQVLALAALSLTLFSACEDANNVTGTTTMQKNVLVKGANGDEEVKAGSYRSELLMHEKGSLLKVMINGGYENMIEVRFLGLKKDQVGAVNISSDEAQQKFGIQGTINMETKETRTSGTEGCILRYEHRQICKDVPTYGKNGEVKHVRECNLEEVPVYGRVDVEQDWRTTNKVIALEFIDEASNKAIGSYKGYFQVERILLDSRYTSYCR